MDPFLIPVPFTDLHNLYMLLLQNLSEIPSLPGLGEDPTIEGEINTQTVGYKALR